MMFKFIIFCSLFIASVLSVPSNEKIDDFEDWNLDDAAEEPKDVDNITLNKATLTSSEIVSHIQKIPRRGEQIPQIHKERDRRDTRKNKKGNKKQPQEEILPENDDKEIQEFGKPEIDTEQEAEIKPSRKPSRKNKQGRGKKPRLNADGEESRKQRKNKKQRKTKQPKNRRNKQKTTTTEAPAIQPTEQ